MQPTGRTVPSSARALIADGDQRNVGLCGHGLEGPQLICKSLDSSKEIEIRIVTWNCYRGSYEAKAKRLATLEPDVAVLQECGPPALPQSSVAWFEVNPRQGVAIVARPPYQLELVAARDGSRSMFPVRIAGPTGFNVLGVWAQPDPNYSAAILQGLALYRDFLRSGPSILLGDFNSSVAWDEKHGRTDHRDLEERLRQEFGLVSAYHAATAEPPGTESRPTHFWRWHEASPYHLDYCYIPESWLVGLRAVTVGTYREWADTSDHRPLVIEVDAPASFTQAAV